MPPVLVPIEIVLREREDDGLREGREEMAVVHFRREDGDGRRARDEDVRGHDERVEHRCGRERGSEDEEERVLPEPAEEMLVGEEEEGEEQDEDERRETEGDVGVETRSEEEAGDREGEEFPGAEPAEEAIEDEREEERHHDGAEPDAGEIDGPVRRRHEECGEDRGGAPPEEFPREEAGPEDGERPEDAAKELERRGRVAERLHGEGLEIDEEPLAAVVVRIEDLVVAPLVRIDRVDAVHRLVGVEPGGERLDAVVTDREPEGDDDEEDGPVDRARVEEVSHI